MQIQSYLFFDGRAEEAIDFYRRNLGAQVTRLLRFKDNPEPNEQCKPAPGTEDKVMHASVTIGDTTVMISDGRCTGQPNFAGFSLTLTPKSEAEADKIFGSLADGGQVQMPMAKTFFSPRFGMVADKFGVSWMVIVLPAEQSSKAA